MRQLLQRTRSGAFFNGSRATILAVSALWLSGSNLARAEDVAPLNSTATTVHLPGKFEWGDLFTDNPELEAKFYTQVFGWTANTVKSGQRVYIQLSKDGVPIADMVQRSKQHENDGPSRWVGFAATDDIAKAVAAVEAAGGKVLAKPRAIPSRGQQAIAADRDGAIFGILQSSSGDVADYQPEPGEIAWAQLFASDPKPSADFYQQVFHYESSADPVSSDGKHLLLSTGEFARAGISSSPPWEGGKSDWLLFICVADVSAAAQQATSLGATVLVQPHPSKHGGQIAVLSDPLGGVIGLLEVETAAKLKETP